MRRELRLRKRMLPIAVLVGLVALSVGLSSAFAGAGRLHLYLVNSGTPTTFYPLSPTATDPNCFAASPKPASLSTSPGTSLQQDNPNGSSTPTLANSSTFSYTADAGFTVPANSDAVILRLWANSGPGGCGGQNGDQTLRWRLECSGSGCGSASLSGGWQSFLIPAGTPINTLFNLHAANASPVQVGAGDTLTLYLNAPSWLGIQWSAPNGQGVSTVDVLTK
jgi:hypothetical protein